MISLQTNVTSLNAQNNLNTDNLAQGKTIRELSSGYRINSSGDDAAGLAIANQYRDNIAELTQGVSNASTGIAQLQIVDGGLSNISTILDRMKTLATESASGTFTGDRNTLDTEYQGLISEITRQATNINLNTGGSFNSALNVYIGGAATLATASVSIDLSGSSNAVDASALGLTGTNVLGGTVGGVGFSGNSVRLDNPGTTFLTAGTQTFTFNYADSSGNTQSRSVVVSGGSSGVSGNDVISQLNSGLTGTGITASIDASTGTVQFTSSNAFTAGVAAATAGTSTVTAAATLVNTSQYNVTSTAFAAVVGTDEQFTISNGTDTANVDLSSSVTTVAGAVNAINSALKTAGITNVSALATGDGTEVSIQGSSSFSVTQYAAAGTSGGVFSGTGSETVTAPVSGGTAGTNADAAITAINAAIQTLGLVQGRVGAGENLLQYATNLANSQIANFSTAQSNIRDADVAADASKLTQGQVLEQTAVAAMAQANSSAQVVLKLLQ